jgi:hypothetical protein
MKRILVFLITMTATAFAQTPTVMDQPAPKAVSVKAAPQSAKPSPSTVKVSSIPAQKPVTVSVPPAARKANALPAAKANATPTVKQVVATTSAKPALSAAPKVIPAPAVAISVKPAGNQAKVAVPAKARPSKAPAIVAAPAKTQVKAAAAKPAVAQPAAVKKDVSKSQTTVAVQDSKSGANDKKPAPKAINTVGRRDPFISPVVNMGAIGSGCSSGKRCLAIDQIALKGVVKADVGMIAVVVNAMDKAYFLRENDPVFNGYVVKITGDSIVFKETFHDKLGKPLTRDVTKTISRPAV